AVARRSAGYGSRVSLEWWADGMASHEEDDVVDEPVFDLVDHDGMQGGRVAGDVDAGCFFLIDHVVAGRDPVQDLRLKVGTVAEQRLVEGAQAFCAVGDGAAVELADSGVFCVKGQKRV